MKKLRLLPLIGLLAGLGISFLVTPRYVSTATLVMREASGGNPANFHRPVAEFLMECEGEFLKTSSMSALIQEPDLSLYPEERSQMPLEDVVEMVKKSMNIKVVDPPGYPRETSVVFQINFPYHDPQKAQAATQKIITRFIDMARSPRLNSEFSPVPRQVKTRIDRLEDRIAELEKKLGLPPTDFVSPGSIQKTTELPMTTELKKKPGLRAMDFVPPDRIAESIPIMLEIIDPASLPDHPEYPNRFLFAGTGFGLGLAAWGLMFAMVVHRRPAHIRQ